MAEEKKQVPLRLPISAYQMLVREAAEESIKRGKTVSVPALLVEIVMSWLASRK